MNASFWAEGTTRFPSEQSEHREAGELESTEARRAIAA
jgi:hypothetical protein